MNTRKTLAALALLGLSATGAHAQTVADVKAIDVASATATPAASLTDNPVVTQIISSSATATTFLVQDSTGAIEIYKLATSGGYTPSVGDTITASGAVTSFRGLFELENVTGPPATPLTASMTGTAALPAPAVFTIANTEDNEPAGLALQSMLGNLSNVSFTGTNSVGSFASGTYTVTDGITPGTTTVYLSGTSPLIGQAIPTGPVGIYGYLNQYDTAATAFGAGAASTKGYELIPLSITAPAAAPEPSGIVAMLIGMGALGLIVARRRSVQQPA